MHVYVYIYIYSHRLFSSWSWILCCCRYIKGHQKPQFRRGRERGEERERGRERERKGGKRFKILVSKLSADIRFTSITSFWICGHFNHQWDDGVPIFGYDCFNHEWDLRWAIFGCHCFSYELGVRQCTSLLLGLLQSLGRWEMVCRF